MNHEKILYDIIETCEFSRSYYEVLGTSPDYSCEREVLVPHGTVFKVLEVDAYLCPDGITRSFVELMVVEKQNYF